MEPCTLVRARKRIMLEGGMVKNKSDIQVNCPCCGWRLFDLEPDRTMGNEVIKIKCSHCKGVTSIKLKKFVLSK